MANEIVGINLQVEGGDAERTVGELRKNLADAVNDATRIKQQFGEASAQFKAAQANVAGVSQALQEASKNAKGLGDNVGAAETPIKGMRARLREATEEMIRLQEEFGELSQPALEAAREVAGLRDQIQEANEVAGLFDPGKSFQSIVGVTSAVAAGFSAAQGAMALFGVESKEVEKALLKVQAAMALSQSLSTVKDSIKDFQRLGAVLREAQLGQKSLAAANVITTATMRAFGFSVDTTAVSFKVLRGAIIATGIGALAVGIGLLVNGLMELSHATDEAAAAQKKLREEQSKAAKEFVDEGIKLLKDAEAIDVAKAKAEGKSQEAIFQIQEDYRKKRIARLNEFQANERELNAQHFAAAEEAHNEEVAADVAKYERQAKAREEAEKKAKEAREKADAKAKADREKRAQEEKAAQAAALTAQQQTADELFAIQHSAEEKELYELSLKFGKRIEEYTKAGKDTAVLVEAFEIEQASIEDKYAKERAKTKEKEREDEAKLLGDQLQNLADFQGKKIEDYDVQLKALEDFHSRMLADTTINTEQRTTLEKEYTKTHNDLAEARTQLVEKERNARVQAAQAMSSALSGFAELAGEQTAAGKTLAIASTTISTIVSAQAAFTGMVQAIPGPWGIAAGVVAAAGAVASGIANVRKIAQVQVPGKGGGSTPSISGGTAPISPNAPTAQATKLDQSTINAQGNAVFKTYVVESDITNAQDRIKRIHNQAKLE